MLCKFKVANPESVIEIVVGLRKELALLESESYNNFIQQSLNMPHFLNMTLAKLRKYDDVVQIHQC